MKPSALAQSALLFLLAGLCEIGGGYLVWLWLREHRGWALGLVGAVFLVLYGVIPVLQPENFTFGRTYAAYGGVFVVLSLLWGWLVDKKAPDRFDLLGGAVCLVGLAIIAYSPRK